ncbi:MAG: NTP transferase domain-containing protein, partial [Lachnospiraceae bacterium]|nr:NTP transferase domain-containing protein [Lachnospiraceae bacterium]
MSEKEFKVDNAIIMAAGYSARCMPLSNIMPKGLFKIKGEVLIEREIQQLKEAGVNEIIVVTGFMAEKFAYLKDKYGVTLIHNADFDKYNNMASLYAAKDYIKNSYILCSDNYYSHNVFKDTLEDSYYSCVYSEKFCDEFCVTDLDEEGYITGIHRGGERAWYTIGDCFFNEEFSKKFVKFMEDEWDDLTVRNMLMDDFHIKHIKDLKLKKVER